MYIFVGNFALFVLTQEIAEALYEMGYSKSLPGMAGVVAGKILANSFESTQIWMRSQHHGLPRVIQVLAP